MAAKLGGCATDPMMVSLSELGSSSKSDVGSGGGTRLKRSINVTGLSPQYIPKGKGSWEYLATYLETSDDSGIQPDWSDTFENSDYRKFHDAVKEHRFVVTHEILPKYGIRLA